MIDKNTALKIAHLARLAISDQEAERYAQQLSSILEAFNQLAKVNTEGVEPMITPTGMDYIYREDQVEHFPGAPDTLLENAPERSGNLFRVPPVL